MRRHHQATSILFSLTFAGLSGVASAHGATAPHATTDTHASHPSATRIVHVTMDDTMRFHPSNIAVHVGETITLDIKNTGKLQHELTIGKLDELQAHAQQMRQHPDMPALHEANAITLDPGHQGTLTWTFATPGTLDFACLIPGHYEAGMKGQFVVSQE